MSVAYNDANSLELNDLTGAYSEAARVSSPLRYWGSVRRASALSRPGTLRRREKWQQ